MTFIRLPIKVQLSTQRKVNQKGSKKNHRFFSHEDCSRGGCESQGVLLIEKRIEKEEKREKGDGGGSFLDSGDAAGTN